jgi:diketogulonate reductase-like aldo/keto reductase
MAFGNEETTRPRHERKPNRLVRRARIESSARMRLETPAMDGFELPSGRPVSRLGQGTWMMGENRRDRAAEVAALRLGLDLGLTLVDTAELYASGRSEAIVGEAIAGRRDEVFVVSKVVPQNGAREQCIKACDRSLRQLKTDYLDLYLLHWRGTVPLAETLEAFAELERAGKIRRYGVSNFDVRDMEETLATPHGERVGANQVLYNLCRRGCEWALVPWCRERGIVVMAYSPFGSSGADLRALLGNATLRAVGERHGATPAQIALAWLLAKPGVVTIPKAATAEHVRENRVALDLTLTDEDLRDIDAACPPPRKSRRLKVI